MMMRHVFLAATVSLLGAFVVGCTADPTSSGQSLLEAQVQSESNCMLHVVTFAKTNGIMREVYGQQIYDLEYNATVAFDRPGYFNHRWMGQDFGQQYRVFATLPPWYDPAVMSGQWQLHNKDSQLAVSGKLLLEKTDNGWRRQGERAAPSATCGAEAKMMTGVSPEVDDDRPQPVPQGQPQNQGQSPPVARARPAPLPYHDIPISLLDTNPARYKHDAAGIQFIGKWQGFIVAFRQVVDSVTHAVTGEAPVEYNQPSASLRIDRDSGGFVLSLHYDGDSRQLTIRARLEDGQLVMPRESAQGIIPKGVILGTGDLRLTAADGARYLFRRVQ